MRIEIYGASDDLIEIDGDISEEFCDPGFSDRITYMGFSEGTVLSIRYDDRGIWRILRECQGTARYVHMDPVGDGYSDVVVLSGDDGDPPVGWVMISDKIAWPKTGEE